MENEPRHVSAGRHGRSQSDRLGFMTAIVVVLGLRPDSEELSPELKGRVDCGIELFDEIDASKLVLTGGYTNDEVDLAESEMMEEYALSKEVPRTKILKEDRSCSTIENAYYARLIQQRLSSDVVYVVTSCYHVERCEFVFERLFPDSVELQFECYESERPDDEIYESEALSSARHFFEDVRDADLGDVRDKLDVDD